MATRRNCKVDRSDLQCVLRGHCNDERRHQQRNRHAAHVRDSYRHAGHGYYSQPTVAANPIQSLATTQCSVSASDSLGGALSYQWSDGGAGGSFSSSTAQNPVYTAPDNTGAQDITVTLSCTATSVQNVVSNGHGHRALTVQRHAITITPGSGTTVNPSSVAPGGTTQCNIVATDSVNNPMTYQWSDGGAGGSFSSSTIANPVYTAAKNTAGHDVTVTLSCKVTDTKNSAVTATGTVSLTVHSILIRSLAVTSSPNAGASIAFSPSPDSSGLATPQAAPCTLHYDTTAGRGDRHSDSARQPTARLIRCGSTTGC